MVSLCFFSVLKINLMWFSDGPQCESGMTSINKVCCKYYSNSFVGGSCVN